MTEREKLISLLGRMSCDVIGIDSCDTCEHRYEIYCTAHAYADHLIANGVTFATDNHVGGKWIPVTERLPESFETVLVYDSTGKRIEAAYMTRHKEWVGVVIKNEITHWMPLPEPPKEGE